MYRKQAILHQNNPDASGFFILLRNIIRHEARPNWMKLN